MVFGFIGRGTPRPQPPNKHEDSSEFLAKLALRHKQTFSNQPQTDGYMTQDNTNKPLEKHEEKFPVMDNGPYKGANTGDSKSGFAMVPLEIASSKVVSETPPEEKQRYSKDYKISSIVDVIKNRYIDPMRKDMLEKDWIKNEWGSIYSGSTTVFGKSVILLHICLFIAIVLFP